MGVLRVSGVNSVRSAEIRRRSSRQFSPDASKLTLKTLKTPRDGDPPPCKSLGYKPPFAEPIVPASSHWVQKLTRSKQRSTQ